MRIQRLQLSSKDEKWSAFDFLSRGETVLLTGPSKVGKTLLAVDLAFCLATGESNFLSELHKPAKVLFISSNDSNQSTRIKLLRRGFRPGDRNVRIMTKWDVSMLNELDAALEDFRPNLTIIDDLTSITAKARISGYKFKFNNVIEKLVNILKRYESAGLLINFSKFKNLKQAKLGCPQISSFLSQIVSETWLLDYQITNNWNPADLNRRLIVSVVGMKQQSLNLKIDVEHMNFKKVRTD